MSPYPQIQDWDGVLPCSDSAPPGKVKSLSSDWAPPGQGCTSFLRLNSTRDVAGGGGDGLSVWDMAECLASVTL